jgi:RimJ/RimL family protein N-acetyltransferase
MDALHHGRVSLQPLTSLDNRAWRKLQSHFRDPEIAHLNGTPPNREPLWLLRRILKADARRRDRLTFGIFDEQDEYIGTCELYDIRGAQATLGIIIGEKSHWNQGYGPEAIRALLDHAFRELGLDRVVLNTYGDNTRAQRAFAKVGFRETGRTNGPDGRVDVHMQLRRDTWRELSAGAASGESSPATPA